MLLLNNDAATINVYVKLNRLHRDVSAANIMIKKNGRGCMNDWDHSEKLLTKYDGPAEAYRTVSLCVRLY